MTTRIKGKKGLLPWILLLSLLYGLSLARVLWTRGRLQALRRAHPPGSTISLKGTVVSLPLEKGKSYRVKVRAPFLVEVMGRGDHPRPGDLIRLWGRVSPIDTFKNPGGMDRRAWYTRQGVAFPIYARGWELLRARNLPLYRQIPLDFASWGISRFKKDLGAEEGPVVSSLVLGFRRGLDWETRQLFTSTGLGHLLAVSGFHMGVAFFFIYTIVKLIFRTYTLFKPTPSMESLPSRRALLPSLAILLFYLLVTGSPPSAQRAFIMIACWVLARFWDRDRSLEGALVLAFLIMTLADPTVIFQVGFQLTFAAMVGVMVVLRWIEPLKGWRAVLGGYLAMAFLIPLFTLPLILFHFHRLAPYSPLANLLLVPPAALLVILGLIHLLLASLALQGWLIPLEKGLVNLFIHGLTAISRLPWASLWVTRKESLVLSALVITGLTGILLVRKGKRWALVLPCMALFPLLIPSPRGALVLDMGKRGRALLLQGEKTVLVDGGSVGGRGAWSALRDALLWRDVHRLDALVTSRIIPSRASMIPRVLETFKVQGLYMPLRGESPQLEKTVLERAAKKGISVERVLRPRKISGILLKPKGIKSLEVALPLLCLREGPRGWYWKGKLLKPWEKGAVEIPWPENPGTPQEKPFKNPSLCSK